MAGKVKSKTDVASRLNTKSKVQLCSYCGNKVEIVMSVSPNGKKRIKRLCCEG